jgi:hypothetical protein
MRRLLSPRPMSAPCAALPMILVQSASIDQAHLLLLGSPSTVGVYRFHQTQARLEGALVGEATTQEGISHV